MLEQTAKFYAHPLVQKNPVVKDIIEQLADQDRFDAMSRPALSLAFGILTGFAQRLLDEREGCLFRIDFQCGCTMRLFFDKKPEVRESRPHAPADCDLRKLTFVAE